MNKCLYCGKDETEVNFTSQEHVFPAGIGGMFELPIGIVCDSCNTQNFSRLEVDFMRNSIISLPRQFYGPGTRGSLNPKLATSSSVHLMTDDGVSEGRSLGVIRKGEPFIIPQFLFSGFDNVSIKLDPRFGNVDENIKVFLDAMRVFTSESKFVFLTDELVEENEFYFGFWENKYYLCAQNRDSIFKVLEYLGKLRIGKFTETTERVYKKTNVQSRQKFGFNFHYFNRVTAKIAFNTLCYLTSSEYCLQPKFDAIRKFILDGGEDKFVTLLNKEANLPFGDFFPKLSHRVIIFAAKEEYIARINFYDIYDLIARLSAVGASANYFNGIICDWMNRQDYVFSDYQAIVNSKHNPSA